MTHCTYAILNFNCMYYSTKNREYFRTRSKLQYSEYRNSVKNYRRQKIKKAFKNLKSLLSKSVIDISI